MTLAIFAGGFGTAEAQHVHEPSMYAGQSDSGIAALSQEEYDALLAGAGMGLARAAELNHYPGPLHVLELADSLHLTSDQRTEVERIRAVMLERAVDLGARIVEAEREMDMRFRHGHADTAAIREATAAIAVLQGELRYTHLLAHIELKQLLEPDQIDAYDRLRGYAEPQRRP
jgi:Spy/CpxP family protein refolding chaperone